MIERLKENKQYVIMSVLLCAVTVFAIYQYARASRLKYTTEIEYNRVFSELTEYVDDLEISLLKGQLVNSPGQMARLSSELYRRASGAKANLALLPIGETKLEKTSEFLSQVGEYATVISQKMQKGEEMTKKELETIIKLTEYAKTLRVSLDKMNEEIADGKISFSEEKDAFKKVFAKGKSAMAADMQNLEEEFHNYPSLIYDGPFSQHLTLKKSVMVSTRPEISKDMALNLAKGLLRENGEYTAREVGGKLPSYNIRNGAYCAEFTKNGGVLLLMMKDRTVGDVKLDINKAKSCAEKFLRENGFSEMRESYFEIRDGSAVINYAYSQDEYIVYPDLVKVKVALDNGEIIGFESRGYIMNHTYREIPKEQISENEALSCINSSLSHDSVTKAVIPLENGSEACCYQIKGVVSDKHYLVYVNTQTGLVEDMQILLESESGTLAV